MSATERLYYAEPAAFSALAELIAVEGERESPLLELDRTLFYPEGGGQPGDLGAIGGIAVVAVGEEGGRVLHRLAGPLAAGPGERLLMEVDAARRIDHSTQHSAQHLVSAVLLRLFGCATVSFHLGAERSTIDAEGPLLSDEDLAEAEARVEEIVAADYPIRVHLCPPEDPGAFPLRKPPPEGEAELRIVEIDGLDYSPCCGTHLSNTGAMRLVKLLGVEKYKGINRLAFAAGARAVADYETVSRNAREAARALGTSQAELAERSRAVAARLKGLETAAASLARERAALEAELAASVPGGLPRVYLVRFADRDAAAAQEAVRALSARGARAPGGATIALAVSMPALTLVAACAEAGARLGEVLGPAAKEAGGKGGGGPTNFRASFPDAAALEAFLSAATAAFAGDGAR